MTIVLAQDEAKALGHREIGSDHLLLGILKLPETSLALRGDSGGDDAAAVLVSVGVNLEALREAIVTIRGHAEPVTGGLPMSNDLHKVLTASTKAFIARKDDAWEPSHFLLGMVATQCVAAEVLDRIGVDWEELRRRLGA